MGSIRVQYGFVKPWVSYTNPGFPKKYTGLYGVNTGSIRVQYGFPLSKNLDPNFFLQKVVETMIRMYIIAIKPFEGRLIPSGFLRFPIKMNN